MIEDVKMFAFQNGSDRIMIASHNVQLAQEMAFEQCRHMFQPIYLLGEIEWTLEMWEMMREQVILH